MGACWSMDVLGPLTRTVEDTALILGAIAGPDERDQWSADVPVPDYAASLEAGVEGLRIGVIAELMDTELVEPEVVASVTEAARVLESQGAALGEVSIPMVVHAGPIHWTLCYVEFGQVNAHTIRNRADEMTHMVRVSVKAGSLIPGVTYYKALQLRELLRRQVIGALRDFDLLICPTMASGATPRAADIHTRSSE